jgi:hypothetical protein
VLPRSELECGTDAICGLRQNGNKRNVSLRSFVLGLNPLTPSEGSISFSSSAIMGMNLTTRITNEIWNEMLDYLPKETHGHNSCSCLTPVVSRVPCNICLPHLVSTFPPIFLGPASSILHFPDVLQLLSSVNRLRIEEVICWSIPNDLLVFVLFPRKFHDLRFRGYLLPRKGQQFLGPCA